VSVYRELKDRIEAGEEPESTERMFVGGYAIPVKTYRSLMDRYDVDQDGRRIRLTPRAK